MKSDRVDFYMEVVKGEDENGSIGVLVCRESEKSIGKYCVVDESEEVFGGKYMCLMGREEEVGGEIEKEKDLIRV